MTLSAALLALALFGQPAVQSQTPAHPGCKTPPSHPWLTPRERRSGGDYAEVETAYVHPVVAEIANAEALLSAQDLIALTPSQAERFTGASVSNAGERTPYLVRAVFPSPRPSLTVAWIGDDLHVFAGGLGCGPFVARPIVVFLERTPRHVVVVAMTAL